MRLSLILTLLLLTSLFSCQSDSPPEPVQYSVPAEVEPYLKSFREEAQKRNVSVSTDNLIVEFGVTKGDDVCAQCLLEKNKTPRITINSKNSLCWQQASQYERECLIFHELGHCLLKRAHKSDRFPNGAFVSLMNPDDIDVYATCQYPVGGDVCDKRYRRDHYIDELFDPTTPTPTWGK